MERALFIEKRDIADLGDLLHIARSIGKKVLNCDRIHISPEISYVNNGYLVLITKEQNGKKTDVERKKDNEESNKKK